MEKFSVVYTIYHIPKRKEWGCTTNLNRRLHQLGYDISDVSETIQIEDINLASQLEKTKNIEYGYGWNTTRDYRVITNVSKLGSQNGGNVTKEKHSKPVLTFDKITDKFVKEYFSVHEAARQLGTSNGNITNILKGRRPSLYGLKFKYKI